MSSQPSTSSAFATSHSASITLPRDQPWAQTRTVAPHYPNLDAARVLAAIAVVWIHTPRSFALAPSVTLGRFAVPFFLGASLLLSMQSDLFGRARSLADYFRSRWSRVAAPFAAWSVIYLGFKVVKRVLAPHQPNDFPGWEACVLGTAFHLWFLPFLFVTTSVAFALHPLRQSTVLQVALGLAAIVIGTVAALLPCPTLPPAWESVTYMWLALPGLAMSLLGALLWFRCPGLCHHHTTGRVMALATLLLSTAALWNHARSGLWEGLAGNAFLYLAMDPLVYRGARQLARLAPLSYGVYLSHLLFLKIAESVSQRLGWTASPALDICCFLSATTLSLALSALLARSRWTRWLIG